MSVVEIAAGHIAPPRDHLPLGAWVEYHHRVSEIRLSQREGVFPRDKPTPHEWNLCGPGRVAQYTHFGPDGDLLGNLPTENLKRNKSLFVWPESGQGIVTGLIRRGIGRSMSGYSYDAGGGREYEPGWFEAEEWHWLYAIKTSLRGLDVVLAPMWATARIESESLAEYVTRQY